MDREGAAGRAQFQRVLDWSRSDIWNSVRILPRPGTLPNYAATAVCLEEPAEFLDGVFSMTIRLTETPNFQKKAFLTHATNWGP